MKTHKNTYISKELLQQLKLVRVHLPRKYVYITCSDLPPLLSRVIIQQETIKAIITLTKNNLPAKITRTIMITAVTTLVIIVATPTPITITITITITIAIGTTAQVLQTVILKTDLSSIELTSN